LPATTVQERDDVAPEAGQPVARERLPPDREEIAECSWTASRIDQDDAGRLEAAQGIEARSAQHVGTAPALRRRDTDTGGDGHDKAAGEKLDMDPERPRDVSLAWESRNRDGARHSAGHGREREPRSSPDRMRPLIWTKRHLRLLAARAAARRHGQDARQGDRDHAQRAMSPKT
jgi:hypothetical protein